MQHQSDVPVPAPQRGGDPAGGQIHPQIQGRGDGGHRGESAAALPPDCAVPGRGEHPLPGASFSPYTPPPHSPGRPSLPAVPQPPAPLFPLRRSEGGAAVAAAPPAGPAPLRRGCASPPPLDPFPGPRRPPLGGAQTPVRGGGAGAAAAGGADVMPVTGHARRRSAGAAVRAPEAAQHPPYRAASSVPPCIPRTAQHPPPARSAARRDKAEPSPECPGCSPGRRISRRGDALCPSRVAAGGCWWLLGSAGRTHRGAGLGESQQSNRCTSIVS